MQKDTAPVQIYISFWEGVGQPNGSRSGSWTANRGVGRLVRVRVYCLSTHPSKKSVLSKQISTSRTEETLPFAPLFAAAFRSHDRGVRTYPITRLRYSQIQQKPDVKNCTSPPVTASHSPPQPPVRATDTAEQPISTSIPRPSAQSCDIQAPHGALRREKSVNVTYHDVSRHITRPAIIYHSV